MGEVDRRRRRKLSFGDHEPVVIQVSSLPIDIISNRNCSSGASSSDNECVSIDGSMMILASDHDAATAHWLALTAIKDAMEGLMFPNNTQMLDTSSVPGFVKATYMGPDPTDVRNQISNNLEEENISKNESSSSMITYVMAGAGSLAFIMLVLLFASKVHNSRKKKDSLTPNRGEVAPTPDENILDDDSTVKSLPTQSLVANQLASDADTNLPVHKGHANFTIPFEFPTWFRANTVEEQADEGSIVESVWDSVDASANSTCEHTIV